MAASITKTILLHQHLTFSSKFLRHKFTIKNVCGTNYVRYLSIRKFSGSSASQKDCSGPLAQAHDPSYVEKGWNEWWEQKGFFTPADEEDKSEKVFSLLLPPPNVTGTLHLGHALTVAVQDALVRWHCMKGHKILWVPGTDHAGIGTHAVVERKLWKDRRLARQDLGREKFVDEIWKWKAVHGDVINTQLKTMGLSLDWSRQYFTMDERLTAAVNEAFCQLYDKGLIYRDKRMINWSCAMQSSLSDIEVDNLRLEVPTYLSVPGEEEKVEFGLLTSFAYPVEDSDEVVVVSTTRLETMLGDTAVAVHPEDTRYSHLVGSHVVHPIDKGRRLPIIADNFVGAGFGSGAVKITPGHDYTDFEVGLRHGLDTIELLNDNGLLKSDLPLVGGLSRFTARAKLREALCLLGYYHGEKPHPTTLPVCSKSGDIVEPRLKEQWFLDCTDMALRASQAVQSGQLKLIPNFHSKLWHEWLRNSKIWCLSRQLWWGHRIPVYTCETTGKVTCARCEEEAKEKLALETGLNVKVINVKQDEDVLDTWFSSSLLPFSALGWPDQTADLSRFFPQQMLETGQDILFFWVARMVMLSLELMKQLPFNTVLLHGMVRDAHGRKMSKSLGNVIDPLDVINGASLEDLNTMLKEGNLNPAEVSLAMEGQKKDFPKGIPACGSDALRFTLCSYNFKNMDINFDVSHAESRKKFCNKIWQSFKFVQSKLGPDFSPNDTYSLSGYEDDTDLWILSRLSHMVELCEGNFVTYDLHQVTASLQQFWYQELCDVYLEAIKPVFFGKEDEPQRCRAVSEILHLCTHTFLRGAAPFMPYLCEELYQRLPRKGELNSSSICIAPYPQPEKYPWRNTDVELAMDKVQQLIQQILYQRKDYNIMGTKSQAFIQTDSDFISRSIHKHMTCLVTLSRSGSIAVLPSTQLAPAGCSSSVMEADVSVFVELKGGALDIVKELERLTGRLTKLQRNKMDIKRQLDKMISKDRGQHPKALKLAEKIESLNSEQKQIMEKMQTLNHAANR